MSQDNNQEYIYGEFIFESQQQVTVAGAINDYLKEECDLAVPLTKKHQHMPMALDELVECFDHVASIVYEPQIKANAEKLARLEQAQIQSETKLSVIAANVDRQDKITERLSQDLAEEQLGETNVLPN